MENFIKNHKTFLHSHRTSCHTFTANQFRLFLHSAAYVLIQALAQIGLQGTTWTKAQVNTLQNRFLKVAGRVCELKTKITFHLPASFPLSHLYDKIMCNLAKGSAITQQTERRKARPQRQGDVTNTATCPHKEQTPHKSVLFHTLRRMHGRILTRENRQNRPSGR